MLEAEHSLKSLLSEKYLSVCSLKTIIVSDLSGVNCSKNHQFNIFSQNVENADFNQSVNVVKIEYENGDTYEGEYLDHKFHGKGKFTSKVMKYDGNWKEGYPHGKGTETWKSGAIYKGFFHFGEKWGQGSYLWPNQNLYEGMWAKDLMNGKGQIRYPNGDVLRGTFVQGIPKGYCEFRFSNGNIYKGQFLNGKINQLQVVLKDSQSTCDSKNSRFAQVKRIRV